MIFLCIPQNRLKKCQESGQLQALAVNQASECFMGGRLHYFAHEWCSITSDPVILDTAEHCHLDINVDDITHLFLGNLEHRLNKVEQDIINGEINKLLVLMVLKSYT